MSDTYIDYRLRKKGHYELQNTPKQQPKNYLCKVFAILFNVSEKEMEGTTFAILKLYLLNRGDELIGFVLVDRLLLEEFIIQDLSSLEEDSNPTTIDDTSYEKDPKYDFVIDKKYYAENNKT